MVNVHRTAVVRISVVAMVLASCAALAECGWANCDVPGFCATESTIEPIDVVLVSHDGRIVSTAGTFPCSGTISLSVTEGLDRVRVAAVWTGPVHPPACTKAMGWGSWSARLSTPLGRRTLLDAATGRPVAWIGGPSLRDPGFLPSGFALTGLSTLAPQPLDLDHRTPCYTRSYVAGAMPHYTELTLSQCPGRVGVRDGWTSHAVTVAGTPGRLGEHIVVWTADSWTYLVASAGEDAPLPDSTLLAIATGLA